MRTKQSSLPNPLAVPPSAAGLSGRLQCRLVFVRWRRHRSRVMSRPLKEFLQRWVINTVAVLVATYVVSGGMHYQKPLDLLVASLVLGLLNAFLRPLLLLLSLPFLIATLGLFTLVINAGLLYLVGWLLQPHFRVDSFMDAFWGALVITLVSIVLNTLTGTGGARFEFRRGQRRPPPRPPGDGKGPVIDV